MGGKMRFYTTIKTLRPVFLFFLLFIIDFYVFFWLVIKIYVYLHVVNIKLS